GLLAGAVGKSLPQDHGLGIGLHLVDDPAQLALAVGIHHRAPHREVDHGRVLARLGMLRDGLGVRRPLLGLEPLRLGLVRPLVGGGAGLRQEEHGTDEKLRGPRHLCVLPSKAAMTSSSERTPSRLVSAVSKSWKRTRRNSRRDTRPSLSLSLSVKSSGNVSCFSSMTSRKPSLLVSAR